MAFEELVPYLPLVYLSIGSTVAYFFAKLLLGHSKEISKAKRSVEVQREKKSFETSIEELVDNAPDMYAKVLSEIEYLKQNGASEKQIASLQKKADMLKMAVDNQEIIRIAGKPIFRYIGKLVGGLGR